MKVSELIPGNKYIATCFDSDACVFLNVIKKISEECAIVSVQYKGRLYFASSYQLIEEITP